MDIESIYQLSLPHSIWYQFNIEGIEVHMTKYRIKLFIQYHRGACECDIEISVRCTLIGNYYQYIDTDFPNFVMFIRVLF